MDELTRRRKHQARRAAPARRRPRLAARGSRATMTDLAAVEALAAAATAAAFAGALDLDEPKRGGQEGERLARASLGDSSHVHPGERCGPRPTG